MAMTVILFMYTIRALSISIPPTIDLYADKSSKYLETYNSFADSGEWYTSN